MNPNIFHFWSSLTASLNVSQKSTLKVQSRDIVVGCLLKQINHATHSVESTKYIADCDLNRIVFFVMIH